MTKRKSKPKLELTDANIKQAVADLEINSPLHRVRLVGNRLELWTRTGILKWPETAAEKKKRLAAKPKPKIEEPPYDSEDRQAPA